MNYCDDDLERRILNSNIEVHSKEAKYYDIIHTEIFNRYEQNRVKKSLSKLTKKFNKECKILEIGSGTGNLTIKLLKKDFNDITCIDISKEMMNELRKKIRGYDHKVKFIVSDIDSFLEKNTSKFDMVLMSSVLHHLPNYFNTLKMIKKLLNDYGCIYVTHEPYSTKAKKKLFVKFLLRLDFFIYSLRYVFLILKRKLKYLNRNCEYSDYHTGYRAINIKQLKNIFSKDYKFEVKKYSVAKIGFNAFLLDRIRYFNSFELIVARAPQ